MRTYLKKPTWLFPFSVFIFSLIKAFKEINNPYFWYDESGQYWMSQGLNHYSAAFSKPRPINDMVDANAMYSFDPGGFTLIVRFWSEVSTNHIWLRLLPEVFFFASMLSVLLILRVLKVNFLTASMVLFIFNVGVNGRDAAFLRPYSAELFAFTFSLYFLVRYEKYKAKKTTNLILAIAFSTFGIWMRYGGIVWSISLFLYLALSHRTKFGRQQLNSWKIRFPIALYTISLVAIYILSFRHQTDGSISKFYYTYLSTSPLYLFNKYNLIFFLILIAGLAYTKFMVPNGTPKSTKEFQKVYLILVSSYVLFSAFGLYPWNPWSHVNAPIPVGLLIFIAVSFGSFRYKNITLKSSVISTLVLVPYLFALFHLGIGNLGLNPTQLNMTTFLNQVNSPCKGEKILVDSWDSPAVRLYFEIIRPDLISEFRYPQAFSFLSPDAEEKVNRKTLMNEIHRSCGIIAPGIGGSLPLENYKEVVPGQVWIRDKLSK